MCYLCASFQHQGLLQSLLSHTLKFIPIQVSCDEHKNSVWLRTVSSGTIYHLSLIFKLALMNAHLFAWILHFYYRFLLQVTFYRSPIQVTFHRSPIQVTFHRSPIQVTFHRSPIQVTVINKQAKQCPVALNQAKTSPSMSGDTVQCVYISATQWPVLVTCGMWRVEDNSSFYYYHFS